MSVRNAFWVWLGAAVLGIIVGTTLFTPRPGVAPSTLLLRGLMLLAFGAVPIVLYYINVRRHLKSDLTSVTESAIDSVYYLGFLVTLTTLLSTVISYGIFDLGAAKNATTSVVFIAVSFGLSLVATALALSFRIDLIQQRDALSTAPNPDDVLHTRVLELDDAYRQLSTVMNDASSRFSQGLDGANATLTQHVAAAERTLSEISATFATAMSANNASLVDQMSSVIDEARTNLREFVKAASLETSSSGLSSAAAQMTSSLVNSGKKLTDLLKRLEALDGRAEEAMRNVDSLGASVQQASTSALEMSQALGRASNGTATLDVEPVRAVLQQLAQTVRRLESAATSAESSYVNAMEHAAGSISSKADDMTSATERLSGAFVSLSDELARSAGVIARQLK
jgi:cytochrome c556